MGTLILTGQAAGGSQKIMKQLIPLLFTCLGQTSVFAQNCWQCLGTGSDISSCAVPGNQTMEVAVPSQAYETSGLMNICMTKVVFNIENCPANGNCGNQAQVVQVSRGLPELELEYQMFMSDGMATNATGIVCTSNGVYLTCTSLCFGNLCNSEVLSTSLASYQQNVVTECTSCAAVQGSGNFNNCLMGTNLGNATKSCIASNKDVGNSNLLGGMCVTVVNYNNETMVPVSVYRGCGVSPQSLIYPVGELEYSTLGQCSPAQISLNGNTMDTMSCVKGYVQDLETEEGAYVANNNRPGPGPMNATCLQCNAVMGDMQFETCLNPNASSSNLAAQGVGEAVCEIGISECSTVFYYNGTEPGRMPMRGQRSCWEVQARSYNATEDCDTDGWFVMSETCTADPMSTNGTLPCNSQASEAIPDAASCYSCEASINQAGFEDCLMPNGTSVMVEQCACGTNACMVTTLYNSNYTVIGVQRGCGNAPGSQSQDACDYTNPSNVDTSNVLCTSQCTASGTPCNDYNNAYSPDSPGPAGSAFLINLSAVLMMITLLL